MKIFHMARLMALSFLVGACAGATIVTNVSYDKNGLPSIVQYVALDRDFRTEIHGNPSGGSKAAFDAAVIAALPGHANGLPTNFTTAPSETARDGYRLVLVFGGGRYGGARWICRDVDSGSLKPVAGRVEVQATFCYRDETLSSLTVSYAPGPSMLGDAMGQVSLNLFPRVDDRDHCNDDNKRLLNIC